MQRLSKFNKDTNFKKEFIIGIYTLLVIGILIVGASYAEYKQETEVTFINAKVRWPKANEITYTNTSNSSVTNVEQALNDLYGKLGK